MSNPLAIIGRVALAFLATVGRLAMFTGKAVSLSATPPFYLAQIGTQLLAIGYFSLPVVGLTAVFTGAALAHEIYLGTSHSGAEAVVPQVVVLGITRELGPVLGGLMVGGRVGAARGGPGRP